MTLQHVDILFKLIVFLFAISFHESAHAWMANRCGDPPAAMLGRISLNPFPPLDGSHVLRHLLPEPIRRVYDTMGWFALLALVYFGGNFLGRLIFPVLGLFNSLLMRM